jgi:group I intron endonuclease
MPIIYMVTNIINNKKYIGADAKNNPKYFGSGIKIKLAIKKYGKNNFKKEILEECNLDELYVREEYWINYYNAVKSSEFYNLSEGGKGGNKLKNQESLNKWKENLFDITEINKKRKNKTYEEIYGNKADEEKNKRKNSLIGKKHTLERRKNQSKSHKNLIPWNKGLTKEVDKRVEKQIKNRKSPKYIKKYILTTPQNNIYEFNGKKELNDFFKTENLKFTWKSRICIDKLIFNGNEKNYIIKIQ